MNNAHAHKKGGEHKMEYAITPNGKIHQVVDRKVFYQAHPQAQDITSIPNVYKVFERQQQCKHQFVPDVDETRKQGKKIWTCINCGQKKEFGEVISETPFQIKKPYWAIIKQGEANGYDTGKVWEKVSLMECDTATQLNNALGKGSVHSGESQGDYYFIVIATSHTNLNELEDSEKEELEDEMQYHKTMGDK